MNNVKNLASRVFLTLRRNCLTMKCLLGCSAPSNPHHGMSTSASSGQDLTKIPVPKLSSTLKKYLEGIRAVVSNQQYEQTKEIVKEFGKDGGIGSSLQKQLVEYAKTKENWATGFWLDDMYLKNPLPLPVNMSAICVLPKECFKSSNDQFSYIAKFIVFSSKFKEKIDKREMPQEYASRHGKGALLCMESYNNFFAGYRRPGRDKDCHIFNQRSNHITVICRNQLFSLHLPNDGSLPSEDCLVEKLRFIDKSSREDPIYPPLGVLTTDSRPEWANVYKMLHQNPTNTESLKKIEDSLYVVCIDGNLPSTKSGRKESAIFDLTSIGTHCLHGNGVEHSSGNRWYDKFLQFVVTRDGISSCVMEHSFSEGVTVCNFEDQFVESLGDGQGESESKSTDLRVERLKWDISQPILTAIQKSSERMNKLASDVDLYVLKFDEYGKGFIKQQGISPDVFIQLSLQLTQYKVHRKLVSTYESASLRKFKFGRVDNIRASTVEALNWVLAMCDVVQVEEEEKRELFQKAIEKQVEILRYTVNGEGPDNHLLALREMSKMKNGEEPAIFSDKSYKEFLNFRLSTSQLSTKHVVFIGYGAVVPDGYGCCYTTTEDCITFCISSFRTSEETSSEFFGRSLEGSLLQMRELCTRISAEEQPLRSD